MHPLHSSTPTSTPFVHSIHPLHVSTPFIHSIHALHASIPFIHSIHPFQSSTPFIHSTHSFHSSTPLIHSTHPTPNQSIRTLNKWAGNLCKKKGLGTKTAGRKSGTAQKSCHGQHRRTTGHDASTQRWHAAGLHGREVAAGTGRYHHKHSTPSLPARSPLPSPPSSPLLLFSLPLLPPCPLPFSSLPQAEPGRGGGSGTK